MSIDKGVAAANGSNESGVQVQKHRGGHSSGMRVHGLVCGQIIEISESPQSGAWLVRYVIDQSPSVFLATRAH